MSSKKPTNSQTISNIYLSRKIMLDLAKHRGFDVSAYDSFSVHEIFTMHSNKQLDMLLIHPETNKKLYFKYHLISAKILPSHVYDYIEDLFNIGY